MKQKITMFFSLAIVGVIFLSVLFMGCTSNNNSKKGADVTLEGFSHYETFEFPIQYISALSLTLQNIGNTIAENVTLHLEIKNNEGNEIYHKEATLNSSLDPDNYRVRSIDVPCYLEDTQLDVNISISWDGGVNHYTRSFTPEFKQYSDVMLESMTHHESYNISNGYTISVDFLMQNRGNLNAENVKIHVIVNSSTGNEIYDTKENVIPILLPWEVMVHEITFPYELDDTDLKLTISLIWDNGVNHYTRSFTPEFKQYPDVTVDSMTHFEHYKLFIGYVSMVTLLLQNKGNVTADNVKMHIIVNDQDGNEQYDSEIAVISPLIPGEIKPQEITIPYDFDDTMLDISITLTWDGGANNYSKSFEPRIFF
jgi:hypothetical protein